MKKLLVTVFVVSLVLALSACSADDVSRFKSFVAGLDEQKVADTINGLQKLAPADATATLEDAPATATEPQGDKAKPVTEPQGDKANLVTEPQTTPPADEKTFITRDKAIELALNHAKLTRTQVRDLETELDRERTGVFWEVDFESGGYEYSYDINAETEAIAKVEKERD
ncbi:MAG: hypothetical protein IKM53_01365 [Clostridia bacterium]|nr:hypothetical protein [Clostridia bacterium]